MTKNGPLAVRSARCCALIQDRSGELLWRKRARFGRHRDGLAQYVADELRVKHHRVGSPASDLRDQCCLAAPARTVDPDDQRDPRSQAPGMAGIHRRSANVERRGTGSSSLPSPPPKRRRRPADRSRFDHDTRRMSVSVRELSAVLTSTSQHAGACLTCDGCQGYQRRSRRRTRAPSAVRSRSRWPPWCGQRPVCSSASCRWVWQRRWRDGRCLPL